MQAKAEFEGGRERMFLVIVLEAGAVVEVITKGGFEIDAKLWREEIFSASRSLYRILPRFWIIVGLRCLLTNLGTDTLLEHYVS